MDKTTQKTIKTITDHLAAQGHTGISTDERWEKDGVYHVATDQIRTLEVWEKEIWFVYTEEGPKQEETIRVTSTAHLDELAKTHPRR